MNLCWIEFSASKVNFGVGPGSPGVSHSLCCEADQCQSAQGAIRILNRAWSTLPSGKLTVCYGKCPFIVDFPINSMVDLSIVM